VNLGLGDTSGCGVNPCTWVDDIYVRDSCLAYLACADPTNPLYIGATQGALAAAGAAVGSGISGSVSGLASGFANSITSQGMILLGAAALILVVILDRKG